MTIALLPLGRVPRGALLDLSRSLASMGFRCELLPEEPVPAESFDPERSQFDADGVLRRLRVDRAERVLAVTTVDLFVEGLTFVFGLANVGGPRALVSLKRLATRNPEVRKARLTKEGLHELGHSWGLVHCTTAGCVMTFSNSLAEVDEKRDQFCDHCSRALREAVGAPLR